MSRTTLRPGATTPAPSRASTTAGPAPAVTGIESTLRPAAAGLAGGLGVVRAGDAPDPSTVAMPAARRPAYPRSRRRRAASRARASIGGRWSATLRTLGVPALERAASRRSRGFALGALARHKKHLHRHSRGVAALACEVGRRLGLDPVELQKVIHTAELHDVGKLALPDEILEKAGPLDDQEWKLMRWHTIFGERIVAALPAIAEVGPLVRSSHERWDGQGYPDGLTGEEIPLASRIVFACDAFDAMTSARPYQRRPRTATEALGELEQCAGTQFDLRVVRALVEEIAFAGGAEPAERAMVGR